MLRQPRPSRSSPPTTGPAAMATPPAAVHTATARALNRSSWAEAWLRSDRELGSSSAAPTPCSVREATSAPGPEARPQPSEAAPNARNPRT